MAVSGTDLKEGEPVIVEGGYNLPEGTPVKPPPEDKAVARARSPRPMSVDPGAGDRRAARTERGINLVAWPGPTSG